MTKEQAKEILRCNTDLGHGVIIENESTESIYEALDMAIKALEQETVSEETYTQEHFARKEAEQKLWKLQQNTSDDCVSRKDVLEMFGYETAIYDLPPVTPTHGICKDCKHCGAYQCGYTCYENHWGKISKQSNYGGVGDFYCADFEKRGSENGR